MEKQLQVIIDNQEVIMKDSGFITTMVIIGVMSFLLLKLIDLLTD